MPSEGPESHGPWDSIPVDSSETFPRRWTAQNGVLLYNAGWWFGTWLLFFHILGMSSSQLTFIFFRGVGQPPTRMDFMDLASGYLLHQRPWFFDGPFALNRCFTVLDFMGWSLTWRPLSVLLKLDGSDEAPDFMTCLVYTILYLKKSWISSSLFHFKFLCLQVNLTWPSGI